MSQSKRSEIVGCLALLVTFTVAVHAPLGRADFSLDDEHYVVGNQSIRSLSEALSAFERPFPPQKPERGLYRPITNLSYAFDFALWSYDSRGYHASNVAIYALVVALTFALAFAYTGSIRFALATGLLFAAHPVHCEAVDSITGRSELLALGFALVSLLLFLRTVRRIADADRGFAVVPALAGSILACALSVLSKETGAVLSGILAVHYLAFGRRAGEKARRWALRGAVLLAPFAAVAIAYLALRFDVLSGFPPLRSPASSGGWNHRILSIGLAFFENLRLLVWPATLHVDFYWERPFVDARPSIIRSGAGWLLLGVGLRVFGREIRRQLRPLKPDATRSAALCALAAFLGFLFPVSHVVPIGASVAERLLFAPSFGFCILAVLAARECLRRSPIQRPTRDRIAALLVAVVVVAGGVRSHLRALEWRDELRLWQSEERVMPDDPRVLSSLAMAYFRRGQLEESRDALARARRADPQRWKGLGAHLDYIERMLERAERR